MKKKLFFLGAILSFFISTNDEVMAQRVQSDRSKANAERLYKRSDKFSLFAGGGLVVMNSDNRKSSWSDGLGDIMRQNGVGAQLGLGAMYQVSPNVAIRGNANYLGFNTDLYHRVNEDLPFSTSIGEVSGTVVVNLISNFLPSRGPYSLGMRRLMVPYITGGVGVLYYSASSESAEDNSGIAGVIPVGGGVRINYSSRISFAPELTLRYTTSDYLDNLKRSGGYTGDNDAYLSATVNVIYTLSSKRKYSFKKGR